ncbi:nucleoside diphosphate kinase, partial [Toxoplasma gondii ARI]
ESRGSVRRETAGSRRCVVAGRLAGRKLPSLRRSEALAHRFSRTAEKKTHQSPRRKGNASRSARFAAAATLLRENRWRTSLGKANRWQENCGRNWIFGAQF